MRRIIMFIVFVTFLYLLFFQEKGNQEFSITGFTMGNITYNVKYVSGKKLVNKTEIDSILIKFNQTFSTYIPTSEISTINNSSGTIEISPEFYFLLKESKMIYDQTNGYFDPTIGPIVNAWGFGPDKVESLPDNREIRKIMNYVGLDKIKFDSLSLNKQYRESYIDFSAIAKGYAVDVITRYLDNKNLSNYFVEIGGEVRVSGKNISDKYWLVGVEDPKFSLSSDIFATVSLNNLSLATSGNYRNFYNLKDSLVYHTIDPKSGYPSRSNMLSASVFAKSCFIADAYATSFMVLGFEKSKKIVTSTDGLDALVIYINDEGDTTKYFSEGIRNSINLL